MAIISPTTPNELPDAPVRGNRATFRALAEAFVAALYTFRTDMMSLASNAYNNATETYTNAVTASSASSTAVTAADDAENARDLAQAAGDVRGVWSALAGSVPIGASVAHIDRLWTAITAIADVTASEPSYSNADWLPVTQAPGGELSKSSAYTVTGADDKTTITCTAVLTLSFESASVLGSGWSCYVKNTSSGDVTLDPYSTQTIDGVSTGTVESGDMFFIRSNGSNLVCEKIAGYKPHYITSSETWTCPAGIHQIFVQLQGPGGGGARGSGTSTGQSGSGGGYSEKVIPITAGTTKTITIGSPGTAGAAIGTNGTSGGTSSFDADITTPGGVGGVYNNDACTLGEIGVGGDLNIRGGNGTSYSGESVIVVGGGSFFCSSNIKKNDYDTIPAIGYGGGGPGVSSDKTGYNGGPSICIISY